MYKSHDVLVTSAIRIFSIMVKVDNSSDEEIGILLSKPNVSLPQQQQQNPWRCIFAVISLFLGCFAIISFHDLPDFYDRYEWETKSKDHNDHITHNVTSIAPSEQLTYIFLIEATFLLWFGITSCFCSCIVASLSIIFGLWILLFQSQN